ncbi:MAG: hypothetical protein AB2551_01085 [Candidatus Thiodiazotropha sp.]
MKILLVIPPTSYVNYPITESGLYCAYLRQAGHSVDLLELNIDLLNHFIKEEGDNICSSFGKGINVNSLVFLHTVGDIFEDTNAEYLLDFLDRSSHIQERLLDSISEYDTVLFVFQYIRTYPSILPWVLDSAEEIKELRKNITIGLVGHGLRSFPSKTFKHVLEESSIDSVFLLEEWDLPEYINENGLFVVPPKHSLKGILNPDLSIYRTKEYLNNRMGTNVVNIFASRGCGGSCVFCNERYTFRGVRQRPPQEVAEEMVRMKEEYNIKLFRFSDSRLNHCKNDLLDLAKHIKNKGLNDMYWVGMLQANHPITKGEADFLYASGCRALWSGIENGSKEIIDLLDKDVEIGQLESIARNLSNAGISFVTLWIKNAPWDNRASITETKKLQGIVRNSGGGVHDTGFRLYAKSRAGKSAKLLASLNIKANPPDKFTTVIKYSAINQPTTPEQELNNNESFIYSIENMPLCSEL